MCDYHIFGQISTPPMPPIGNWNRNMFNRFHQIEMLLESIKLSYVGTSSKQQFFKKKTKKCASFRLIYIANRKNHSFRLYLLL